MTKQLTLDELISVGAVPKETELVRLSSVETMDYREYEKRFNNGESLTAIPVINDVIWIAKSKKLGRTYSCNGEGKIGNYNNKRKTFSIQTLDKKENTLTSDSYVNFKRKDEIKMSEPNLNPDEILAGLAQEDFGNVADVAMPATEEMKGFDGIPVDGNNSSLSQDEISEIITANTEDVELADSQKFTFFNQQNGKFVGYVTTNDAIIKCGTSSKVKKDTTGKKMLLEDVPKTIKDAFMNGEKNISSKYFVKDVSLEFRQSAPGKVLGGVVAIPAGGKVDITELQGEGPVDFNKEDRTLQYLLLPKDSLNFMIANYFDGTIKEAPETFGAAASKLRLQAKIYNKKKNDEILKLVKYKLVADGRNKPIVPGSYFPIKTYETINPNSNLNQEQCDLLNKSAFNNLFQPGRNSNKPKILELNDVDRQKVKNEGGKITSVFFTTNAAEREQLEITPYWAKRGEEVIEVPEIAVKEEVTKKDGGKRLVYKTYNSLDKKVAEDSDYKAKTPLYGTSFKAFLDACHGAITEESLRGLTKRGSKSQAPKGSLEISDVKKLLMKSMQAGLSGGLQVEGSKKLTIEDFREELGNAL